MPGASFEAVTGRLGIGAIAFLGLFLAVDGLQIGVFELIELYGKSSTWGIVGVIPTTVVIYVVGVFCLGIADLALSRIGVLRGPTPRDVIDVGQFGGTLLQQMFADHTRTHDLLKGASVSFVVLAAGSVADLPNIRGQESIVIVAVAGALLLSGLSLLFASRAASQAAELARAARREEPPG